MSQDGGSADVIYAVGSNELIYPASTIKMLTALTVLDIARPEEKVLLGTEIYIPPLDASRAGLEYGMTLTVRDLLEGLLLPSGADAAYALGVYCGRKLENNSELSYEASIASFVAAMNRKAEALGAWNTTVRNVVGLDDRAQKTTAEDILRIAKVFLDQPVLAEICGLAETRIASDEGKIVSLSNTNKMLHPESIYQQPHQGRKNGHHFPRRELPRIRLHRRGLPLSEHCHEQQLRREVPGHPGAV